MTQSQQTGKEYNENCGLSKDEWEIEQIVDKVREVSTLHAIGILRKWKEQQFPAGTIVYVPIEIKEGCELPPIGVMVTCYRGSEWTTKGRIRNTTSKHKWSLNAAKGLTLSNSEPTHWLKETTIPNIAELLKEIDGLKAVRNTLGDMNNRVMEDLRTANEEIQRLKEVIKIAWWRGISEDYANDRLIKHWQQFKTDNQL